MPLTPVPDLPMAIPAFRQGEMSGAWSLIGQKEQYIVQLQAEMLRRAEESNRLDDENKELTATVTRIGEELGGARTRIADLELAVADKQRELDMERGLIGSKATARRRKKA